MQWLQQNMQVVIFLIFILISAISGISRKVKELKAPDAAKQAKLPRTQALSPPTPPQQPMLQRGEEARPGPANPAFETERSMPTEEDALRRLRDLAERRRAELQELTRRSQKGGLSGVGGAGGTPGQQATVSAQRPDPAQTRPQTARGTPDPRKKNKPAPQRQRAPDQERQRQSAAYAAATGADFGESTTTRLVADAPVLAAPTTRGSVGAGLFTAESLRLGTPLATGGVGGGGGGGAMQELRRSFALMELIRPPLSLRSPDQEPLALPSGAPIPPRSDGSANP